MSEQGGPVAPAGWYPQPDGTRRYWDGAAWTQQVRPAPMSPLPPAHPAYGTPTYVTPKNPTLMLLASFFVPGLGTILNGEIGKGVGILIGYLVGFVFSFVLIGLPFALGFWIWGMVDAHIGAVKWNARHGVVAH